MQVYPPIPEGWETCADTDCTERMSQFMRKGQLWLCFAWNDLITGDGGRDWQALVHEDTRRHVAG